MITSSMLDKYLLGGALLLAITLGGNSAPGFWLDQLVQAAMILAAGLVIWRNPGKPYDRRLIALILAAIAVAAFQLVPLPAGWIDPTQNLVDRAAADLVPPPVLRPITLGIGRTIEALVWLIACGFFTVALTRLDFDHVHALVPIFLIGVLFHLVAGLIQYSAASSRQGQGLLGFPVSAGFFANSNHFSALVFTSIPLAFAYFFDWRRLSFFLIYLICALLILLAVGSRAGVLIGMAITLLSGLILLRRDTFSTLVILAVAGIGGIFALGTWTRISSEGLGNETRLDFAQTTLQGLLDSLPFGIGFGGFVHAYPAYEQTESIFPAYVNHAHNDFLELAFEGGLPAIVVIAAALFVLSLRIAKTIRWPLHFACALAIGFLVVHSIVDYPLRTLAISASLSLMIGILFHPGGEAVQRGIPQRIRRRVRVKAQQEDRIPAGAGVARPRSSSSGKRRAVVRRPVA